MSFQTLKIVSFREASAYSEATEEPKDKSNEVTNPRLIPFSIKENSKKSFRASHIKRSSFIHSDFPELKINLADEIDSASFQMIFDHLEPIETKFTKESLNKIKILLENPTYRSKNMVNNHTMISTFYFRFSDASIDEDDANFYDIQISKFLYNSILNSLNSKNFHRRKTLRALLNNITIDQFQFVNHNLKTLSLDVFELSLILERHLSEDEIPQVINLLVAHYKSDLITFIKNMPETKFDLLVGKHFKEQM